MTDEELRKLKIPPGILKTGELGTCVGGTLATAEATGCIGISCSDCWFGNREIGKKAAKLFPIVWQQLKDAGEI